MRPLVAAGIFARGGSKGVRRKNIREVAGKPLIAYAVETARASALIDRVFVSTDDPEIAEVALRYGAEVPFVRPAELARDDSPEWAAWQHAIRCLDGQNGSPRWDAFVCVPTTSPLRSVEDIDRAVQALLEGDADVVITVRPSARNPYFNMVTIDPNGYARLVLASGSRPFRRQDAPEVFDITTVAYAAVPSFILSASSIFDGRVRTVVVPTERALDVDTEHDLEVAALLLRAREGRR